MALLKIARMGHPILIQRAAPVTDPGSAEIRHLVADMFETMEDASGVGLAGPQVYQPLRLFVFRVPAGRAGEGGQAVPNSVLINPVITPLGEERELGWEGCLSIPGLRAVVPRWKRIRYEGVDIDGAPVAGEAEGFHARVIQHEYDHLDGVMYPSRVEDFRLFGFEDELMRMQATTAQQPKQDGA